MHQIREELGALVSGIAERAPVLSSTRSFDEDSIHAQGQSLSSSPGLTLTLDEVAHPAYMFNYRFELVWYNDAARRELLGAFSRLPDESEERHILPMMLQGLASWTGDFGEELVRANLALAKSRLNRDTVLSTCRLMRPDMQRQISELYDQAPAAETSKAAATVIPIDLPNGAGRTDPHRLIATYFREGIFVVCVPEDESGGSLADFLSRRDLVIRHLLKKRLPVLTPLAVLVTDLQASTRICSELPPEEYFELINEIWSAMDPIFRRYFGTHGKHVGDGMVYYFFPQPDSHYVMNAVRCADELRAEMRKISSAWSLRKGWFNELFLNTGLHEGTEWLGTFQTATTIEFSVLGDTINQAARLSDFARHGGIWATKGFVGKLTADEKSKLVYGVSRRSQDGRDVFVESTFAQIESLVDISRNEKLRDIAALPITQIQQTRNS
jgi:class 3 adenylate cyclase